MLHRLLVPLLAAALASAWTLVVRWLIAGSSESGSEVCSAMWSGGKDGAGPLAGVRRWLVTGTAAPLCAVKLALPDVQDVELPSVVLGLFLAFWSSAMLRMWARKERDMASLRSEEADAPPAALRVRSEWHRPHDAGADLGPAADRERPAPLVRPLPDVPHAALDQRLGQSAAVVGDGEHDVAVDREHDVQRGRLGMPTGVGDGLRQDGEQVGRHLRRHERAHRPLEGQAGSELQGCRGTLDDPGHLGLKIRRLAPGPEREDRAPDVLDGCVEVVHRDAVQRRRVIGRARRRVVGRVRVGHGHR